VETPGVALVECDVRIFRGRAEVRHLKTLGPLPILWDRWRVANPFAPRLELSRVLEACTPETELMLDLKGRDRRLARLVLDALSARPLLRVTVCARSAALLEPFRPHMQVRTVYSIGRKRHLRALARRFDGRRYDGVSIHERLLDRGTVRQLARYADLVMTWPVRTVEQAQCLLDWGVHGLITDVPEQLAPIVSGGPSA
jgi:glycerophosphoryl diester phosphodiesterase